MTPEESLLVLVEKQRAALELLRVELRFLKADQAPADSRARRAWAALNEVDALTLAVDEDGAVKEVRAFEGSLLRGAIYGLYFSEIKAAGLPWPATAFALIDVMRNSGIERQARFEAAVFGGMTLKARIADLEARHVARGELLMRTLGRFAATEQRLCARIASLEDAGNKIQNWLNAIGADPCLIALWDNAKTK